MISKQRLIDKITNEARIIKHLASKVTTEMHGHQFSEKQRTIHDLLAYLGYMELLTTQAILLDNADAFKEYNTLAEKFEISNFDKIMDDQVDQITQLINATSDEKMNETVTVMGRFTDTRGGHMIGIVLPLFIAYKMQLFLQIKHSGVTNIGTSNLRAGMDMPQA